jgi:hypothetical protein
MSPSERPIEVPTFAPTATLVPTRHPTQRITASPSLQKPSLRPSEETSKKPTKFPIVRPTIYPTLFTPQNIIYFDEFIVNGGQYIRNKINNTNYIINITSNVVITRSGKAAIFTIIPNPNTTITIEDFNISHDIISFRIFGGIFNMWSLSITMFNFNTSKLNYSEQHRNLLVIDQLHDLRITLPNNQLIYILNTSQTDLQTANFIFSPPITQNNDNNSNNKTQIYVIVSGGILTAAIITYFLYLFVVFAIDQRKRHNLSLIPINWDKMRDSNPTFVIFGNGDSDQSFLSDDSNNSSSSEGSESLSVCSPNVSFITDGSVKSAEQNDNNFKNNDTNNNNLTNNNINAIIRRISNNSDNSHEYKSSSEDSNTQNTQHNQQQYYHIDSDSECSSHQSYHTHSSDQNDDDVIIDILSDSEEDENNIFSDNFSDFSVKLDSNDGSYYDTSDNI